MKKLIPALLVISLLIILTSCQASPGPQGPKGDTGPSGSTPSEDVLLQLIGRVIAEHADELRGPVGPPGPQGLAGPQGLPGQAVLARQIVVTWDSHMKELASYNYDIMGYFAATEVELGQSIRIMGTGFDAGNFVTISICDDNIVLVEEVITNECGAFEAYATVPKVGLGLVSIRAWLNAAVAAGKVDTGDLQACWTLKIVKELPRFPWVRVRW